MDAKTGQDRNLRESVERWLTCTGDRLKNGCEKSGAARWYATNPEGKRGKDRISP
jgi:hypothetical protein